MNQKAKRIPSLLRRGETGQALIEYALILVLVSMALIAALIATGPAIANVFSNTVCNLVGLEDCSPDSLVDIGGGPESFWLTVTWVAMNPPKEGPIPTKDPNLAPTEAVTPGNTFTATPDTPTATIPPTETEPPSPTPEDFPFQVRFDDPINNPEWWRVDSSIYLGGEDWWGEYYPNRNLQGSPEPAPEPPGTKGGIWNYQINPVHKYNINFNWGAAAPLPDWSLTDDFSVRWTRSIYVPGDQPVTVSFTIQSIGGVRFWVDDSNLTGDTHWTNRTLNDAPVFITQTLSPGTHTLKLEYYAGTGDAAVMLDINAYKGNVPADQNKAGGSPSCQWTRVTGSQPNTVAWAWKESPLQMVNGSVQDGFPPNMRCHLELRGSIELINKPAYKMSFWDVWDLAPGDSVKLQIAEYHPYVYIDPNEPDLIPDDDIIDPASGPNWAGATEYVLHTGGKNYGWTYNVVDIPASLYNKQMTYRFVIESGGGAGPRRWYLDDIVVDNLIHPLKNFNVCTDSAETCGNYWDLNDTGQTTDFLYTARWNLTSNNVVDGTSWDASTTSGTYVKFGPEQPANNPAQPGDHRVHAIEFNGQVRFQNMDQTGTGGPPDYEGNTGVPILRFYQTYDLESGTSLEIQYTRDAYDAVPDNWQTVGQPLAVGPTASATMQEVKVDLSTIPDWWQQPFRLRFAMKVDGTVTPNRPGWQIDNIAFVRKGIPRYSAYPFCDGADKGDTGMENWLSAGGWGVVSGGVAGTPRAFADSPTGNYRHGLETWMELKYPIDFNNDTPENLTNWGGNKDCDSGAASGAAVDPILVFWHKRDLAASDAIYVDIMRPARPAAGNPAFETTLIDWTPVWSYVYDTPSRTNLAWERVEIHMRAAILNVIAASGVSLDWQGLKTNANPYDDDFYFRIRLDGRVDPSVADGVYVDGIDLRNYSEVSHRLWETAPGIPGDGRRYDDDIDNPVDWWNRWRTGAWSSTSGSNWNIASMPYWWKSHSSAAALTDSSPTGGSDDFRTPYLNGTFSVLELTPIIDLTQTKVSDDPMLYFWNHYDVGTDDAIRVQVAVEDASRTQMGYDYIYGWGSDASYNGSSSWETLEEWARFEDSRVDTWIREQISLKEYVGKRIRLRFVVDAFETASGLRDGWYLDDLVIEFRNPTIMPFPFVDQAKNTENWITEGLWGLDPNQFKGSGGTPANLGPDKWHTYFMKCLRVGTNTVVNCSVNEDPANATAFLDSLTPTVAYMNAYVAGKPTNRVLPALHTDTISYDLGSTGRPPGAPNGNPGNTWNNQYVARFIRNVTLPAGEYSFIITSDDGVRMRYEPASTADTTPPYNWNILNNWNDHDRHVDMVNISVTGGDYNMVLEWYEADGNAVIILQAGSNNFSFTDSPPDAPDQPVLSVPYGNSSLLLDGVLNLNKPSGLPASQWKPGLRFYTLYDLDAGSSALVEVSIDGGLTWMQEDLAIPAASCPATAICQPTIFGSSNPADDWFGTGKDWQLRALDLTEYGNRPGNINFVVLRFRLNTLDQAHDGWWITDITVNNF